MRRYEQPVLHVVGQREMDPAGQQAGRAKMRYGQSGQGYRTGGIESGQRQTVSMYPDGRSGRQTERDRNRRPSGQSRGDVRLGAGGSPGGSARLDGRGAGHSDKDGFMGGSARPSGRGAGRSDRDGFMGGSARPSGRGTGQGVRPAPGRRSASVRRPDPGTIPARAALTPGQRRRERKRRERLRRARMRRRIVFALWQVIFVAAIAVLFIKVKSGFDKNDLRFPAAEPSAAQGPAAADAGTGGAADEPSFWQRLTGGWSGSGEQTYADYCGLDAVDRPVKREPEEVQRRLSELAQEYDLIAEICANQGAYPDNMLEALANNPEMADFVAGYPTAAHEASGGLTETEQGQEYPLFLQWDPRWGYAPYGDNSNIGLAGCGPVSLSMALYYLTGDTSLTPDVIASYAMNNGYYMAGTGTAWALMTDVPGRYGVSVTQPGIEESRLKYELDQGRVIICAMRAGDFTAAGHFIVIYGYDADGFLVNDPNCVARSRQSWPYEQIQWQIKQLWSLGTGQSGSGTQSRPAAEPGGQSGTGESGLWKDADPGIEVEEWFEENGSIVFKVAE